jgi:hypothetical protein
MNLASNRRRLQEQPAVDPECLSFSSHHLCSIPSFEGKILTT